MVIRVDLRGGEGGIYPRSLYHNARIDRTELRG